ncbi:hypothetical protein HU200_032683 [Digitaria exilis]|uniref:VOC domain-containing protein n=1 Tax=Digitaria exilis TaxID=1010633 RepID=A0A835BMQ8_9POAL|nr:hypothetical protein HU200_032683 [Digitaria exilis]
MVSHEEPEGSSALPLVRLNHVSFQCASVEASVHFYQRVLGFGLVKRPASLDFEGACCKAGCDQPQGQPHFIPGDHPGSFRARRYYKFTALLTRCAFAGVVMQCTDMGLVKARLRDMKLDFVAARVRDGETVVEQLFFHDPDGNMIEICDCEKLPVIPLADAAAGLPDLFGD